MTLNERKMYPMTTEDNFTSEINPGVHNGREAFYQSFDVKKDFGLKEL